MGDTKDSIFASISTPADAADAAARHAEIHPWI